jgi:hypothetical protein
MTRQWRTREDEETGLGWARPLGGGLEARRRSARARALRPLPAIRSAVAVHLALALALALLAAHVTSAALMTAPASPSAVCGSPSLDGPSSAPEGAITVAAGDNSAQSWSAEGATYWLAPGVHTIGTGQYDQIQAADGVTIEGAPGAVLSGQGDNEYAIVSLDTSGADTGITVEYLTVENFIPGGSAGALNETGTPGWTIKYDTVEYNAPGSGMMLGSDNVIEDDCLVQNGQYAFNGYSAIDLSSVTGGPSDITVSDNEIAYNDTCNWEDVPSGNFPVTPPSACAGIPRYDGCGCSGGGKFWHVLNSTYTGNYVLDNYNVGVWWDTDNAGETVTGDYFQGNFAEAVIVEVSYNAYINGNDFVDNSIGAGQADLTPGFPSATVYISESGSDDRGQLATVEYGTQFAVTGNYFWDNFGGVDLWENSNRFCGTLSTGADAACTLDNDGWTYADYGSGAPCSQSGNISGAPYLEDCRWKTQNVAVSGNTFYNNPSDPVYAGSCTTENLCGYNGIFSEVATYAPYSELPDDDPGYLVADSITYDQDNEFAGNTYCGSWGFESLLQGNAIAWSAWQASPSGQDAGSTMNGPGCAAAAPAGHVGGRRRR